MMMMMMMALVVSVLCLMRAVHARFLSDTTHCSMVTSNSVCRTTVPESGWGLKTVTHQVVEYELVEDHFFSTDLLELKLADTSVLGVVEHFPIHVVLQIFVHLLRQVEHS